MNAARRTKEHSTIRRQSGVRPALRAERVDADAQAMDELEERLSAKLVEELGRLGCRCAELGAQLAALAEAQSRSRFD